MKNGLEQIKVDAITPEEAAVLNALQYLESIANKGYSYVINELTDSNIAKDAITGLMTILTCKRRFGF